MLFGSVPAHSPGSETLMHQFSRKSHFTKVNGKGIIGLVLLAWLLMGCTSAIDGPTPFPTEFLPTAIALTIAADQETAAAAASLTPAPPTPSPTPTAAALLTRTPKQTLSQTSKPTRVAAATRTPRPTRTPAPTPTPTTTPTPTITFTPSPTPPLVIPKDEIEFNVPGQLSQVTSPIPIRVMVLPSPNEKVYIELLGEDGRLLARKIELFNPNLGRKIGMVTELDFDIPGVAELARLQIYTLDEFGRPRDQNSVDLILLSVGNDNLNVAGDQLTRIFIQSPPPESLVQGGKLIVSGLARPLYNAALVAELINERGGVVGSRLVEVAVGPPEEHRLFVAEIPYQVSEPTWVRLVIRERGERIQGTAYLVSQLLLLSP